MCKCGCRGACTFNAVWEIIAWMLRVCLTRTLPCVRHDGIRFEDSELPGDDLRAKRAGRPLPFGLVIGRMEGDWSWMKSAMGFCGWRDAGSLGRCCYLCSADCQEFCWTDPSMNAKWRSTVFDQHQQLAHLFFQHRTSAVWSFPGFTVHMVSYDWMHVVDLGVSVVVMGNVVWEITQELGGRSMLHKLLLPRSCP